MFRMILFNMLVALIFGNLLGCTKDPPNTDDQTTPPVDVINPFTGEAYFVAPWGDDSDPGTFEKPWATWGKAFNSSSIFPGDTVVFRGGIYYKDLAEGEDRWYHPARSDDGTGYAITRNGTADNPVYFMNFPGEIPILDCSRVVYPSSTSAAFGIRGTEVEHVRFIGLTLRNVFSVGPETSNRGWNISGTDIVYENCSMYNIHGTGFANEGCKDIYYINCDAYNCIDTLWVPPGELGTGFTARNVSSRDGSVYYKYCRAWNCSDQGFSAHSISFVEWDGCWSVKNGSLSAGGHGIKIGFVPQGTISIPLQKRVVNCIGAFNRHSGFTTNDGGYPLQTMHVHNNIAYHNGYFPEYKYGNGFRILKAASSDVEMLERVFRNNISYDNEAEEVLVAYGALYNHSNNSWDSGKEVSNADFLSVDSTGLIGPRQADGSLPDIDFLKLAEGSDLIDSGIDVGLPFLGTAPDLGAFERE